jgi:uncharacterized membrane protein
VPAGSVRTAAAWWGAGVAFAAVAGRFAPLTAPAEFAALLAGGAITAWALGAAFARPVPALLRREASGSLGGRGWLAWVAVLVAFLALEIYSLASATPADHPTLSALSRPLLAPSDHRALGYLLWLASGVWVARR